MIHLFDVYHYFDAQYSSTKIQIQSIPIGIERLV